MQSLIRILAIPALALATATASAATGALADYSDCYRTASSRSATLDCLKREVKGLKASHAQATTRLADALRNAGTKKAATNVATATKAFEKYVAEECNWIEAGAGGDSSAATLACQANLYRVRLGLLQAQGAAIR